MELSCAILTLLVLSLILCVGIIVLSDSDIITAIYARYGKDPEKEFANKVVWVIGASSGIGEALVKQIAKCNSSRIVISARRKYELERVKKQCLESNKMKKADSILVLPMDMLDYDSHETALQKVLSVYGKLDILVCNAGRLNYAPWHEIDISVDKEVFDLNVFSIVHLNRIVVKHFMKVGGGHLAVTSSIASKMAAPDYGSYPASKAALNAYFETLRNEVSSNIAITLLLPGPIATGIYENSHTSIKNQKSGLSAPPEKRMSAERCGFLCSVALANRIQESWISPAFLLLIYIRAYSPFIYSKIMQLATITGARDRIRKQRKEELRKSS